MQSGLVHRVRASGRGSTEDWHDPGAGVYFRLDGSGELTVDGASRYGTSTKRIETNPTDQASTAIMARLLSISAYYPGQHRRRVRLSGDGHSHLPTRVRPASAFDPSLSEYPPF